MLKEKADFSDDEIYLVNSTGDCVVGDEVIFERAVFSGTYKKPIFEGYETIEATILKESYGQKTGQHTFTLKTLSGDTIRIKGRNLYRNGVWRKPWKDETLRKEVAQEKHGRGRVVRANREHRQNFGY